MHTPEEVLEVFWPRATILGERVSERSGKDWEIVDLLNL